MSNEGTNVQTFSVNGVLFDMVKVEAGSFLMGATPEMQNPYDDEKPVHRVTLTHNYYIGKTPVTQALWKTVIGSNPSHFKSDNKPVECVSWDNCYFFVSKLNAATGRNFRLPTEAEWEFAARGGNKSKHYQYSGSDTPSDVAWYGNNSGYRTHDVATKLPNELGIYDMSGNVFEWCSDWYSEYESSALYDPEGPLVGPFHVFRGGVFCMDASACRSSRRGGPEKCFFPGMRLALTE